MLTAGVGQCSDRSAAAGSDCAHERVVASMRNLPRRSSLVSQIRDGKEWQVLIVHGGGVEARSTVFKPGLLGSVAKGWRANCLAIYAMDNYIQLEKKNYIQKKKM